MKMTQADIEKIREEIAFLKGPHRDELLAALKTARAQGDLSENFEYTTAKRANNQNNSRVRYLENLIKNATVIKDDAKDDEVGINKSVTVYIPEDDEEETYKIVTTIRGDSTKGRISTDSPMGKALLHKKVGDRVTVVTGTGYEFEVEIRRIEAAADDNSDDIRKY